MSDPDSLKILLVDDEEIIHQTIADYLRDTGQEVIDAHDGVEAMKLAEKDQYDLALVDVKMPKMDGMQFLEECGKAHPELSVVIMTGHGSMDTAISALRLGASDFLTKPIKLRELDAVIAKAYNILQLKKDRKKLSETVRSLQNAERDRIGAGSLIGKSKQTEKLRHQIEMAAEARVETVMITGDTGVGKEVVARALHDCSADRSSPFIAVACPALPETLAESELFGHSRGAFTGATADRAGYFEMADKGTLFLDEIADLSAPIQAKLLRALETRRVRRVGEVKEISISIRVIAATNVPLEQLVEEGKFRRDLYYRLNVFSIEISKLHERPEDIIELAEHFLASYHQMRGTKPPVIGPAAQQALLSYEYPGNARELRNIIERAAILCRTETLELSDLSLPRGANQKGAAAAIEPVSNVEPGSEQETIISALQQAKWNRRDAAKLLGMPYSTLRYKMKKFEIG